MKQTTKNILGLGLVIAISSGVAGVTTSLITPKRTNATYDELFQQNPNVHHARYDLASAAPVDFTLAAENSVHAVVHIKSTINAKTTTVEMQDPFSDFFGDFFGGGGRQQRKVQQPKQEGVGSGVIISKDGYIVTNNHVIDNSDEITVTLNDKREFKARLIGADASTDLALLKIEGDNFPTLPVGNSDEIKIGEWVLAVGNPFNLSSTVTAGIVSAKARNLNMGANGGIESFIQTDAAVNRGNSGGALVNTKGELVGINSAIYSPTGAYTGYGFAIPVSIMTKIVADLKQYGTVQRALLGIRGGDNNAELSKEKGLGVIDGVYIEEVTDGGSAADAGLKSKDVIVAINGKTIKSMAELQEAIARQTPGSKIKVKIVRDKKERTIDVTLKNSQGTTKVVKNAGMEVLGAAFKELPKELKEQLKLSNGLLVTGVTEGKMQESGISKGFIILKANGEVVKSVDDLERILKAATQSPEQVLFMTGMFSSGKRANYAVDLSTKD